jgi:hypothetical protein
MAKKQESILGLVPLAQGPNFGDSGHIVTLGATRASNRDEQWVLDEYQKQALIMVGVEAKAVHAMKLIAEIHKEGVVTFEEAAGYIQAIQASQRGKEHQAYLDEFSKRAIQLMGRHLLATAEVAATNIGVEVHRTLYPPPLRETPSMWKRIFG